MTLRRVTAGAATAVLLSVAAALPAASASAAQLVAAEPTLQVLPPASMAPGAQPAPLSLNVAGLAAGADAQVRLTLAELPPAWTSVEVETADGSWQALQVTGTETSVGDEDVISAVADVPVGNGETRLRVGFPLDASLFEEEPAAAARLGASSSTAELRAGLSGVDELDDRDAVAALLADAVAPPQALDDQHLAAQLLVDGAPVGSASTSVFPLYAPTISFDKPLPEEVDAGDTLLMRLTLSNATGSDYTDGPAGYDSTLSAALTGSFVTEEAFEDWDESEELEGPVFPPLDPAEVSVSCAPAGEALTPVTPVASELLSLFLPTYLVGRAELADGDEARFDCEVVLADDLPEGMLLLSPVGLVGASGFPIAGEALEEESLPILVRPAAAGPVATPAPPPAGDRHDVRCPRGVRRGAGRRRRGRAARHPPPSHQLSRRTARRPRVSLRCRLGERVDRCLKFAPVLPIGCG
jgi:hypothetical protein